MFVLVLKPDLLEKEAKLFTNQHLNLCESDKEQKKTLENCFFISVEVCNNYYEKKTLKKEILNGKNEHFPKNIDNIFTEMFVYDMFVPLCQHMVDFCGKLFYNPTTLILYSIFIILSGGLLGSTL